MTFEQLIVKNVLKMQFQLNQKNLFANLFYTPQKFTEIPINKHELSLDSLLPVYFKPCFFF